MDQNILKRTIFPYRIIPFDIGENIDENDRHAIYRYFYVSGYSLEPIPSLVNNLSSDILFRIRIMEELVLYIYAFGIGVFVLKDESFAINDEKYAVDYCALRKQAHNALLSEAHPYSKTLWNIREAVRSIVRKKKTVRTSANDTWENHGLSYVMTVSFIQNPTKQQFEYGNLNEIEKKNLMIMLEPSIAHQEDSMIVSLNQTPKRDAYDFPVDDLAVPKDWVKSRDCSIYISWAAVVVCMNEVSDLYMDLLLCLEVDLQAMWLYVYCLYYNLRQKARNKHQMISDLKNELFYIRRKYNSFKSKSDSSVPAYVSNIRNELILTSGIDEEYKKYNEYLNFYIDEAESLDKEKQKKYNVLSEILLFFIAFVQIAPMLYGFLTGEYADLQVIPTLVVMLIGAVACIAIIKKE